VVDRRFIENGVVAMEDGKIALGDKKSHMVSIKAEKD
jgi:hypothetical protein